MRVERARPVRMRRHGLRPVLVLLAAATVAGAVAVAGAATANPPVRALTAFVKLEPARYEQQLAETASYLKEAQALLEKGGFTVQTLRITTQPFMLYVARMTQHKALGLLSRLGQIGKEQGVLMNIGPAVLDDRPDPEALALLEELQSHSEPLVSSMIIAADDGIHWNTVRAAAHHVWRVAARSPRSQGTFGFAATAMLAPGSPFYPGSWHAGQGGRFSIGLQSAGTAAEVLSRAHGDAPRAVRELTAALNADSAQLERIATEIESRTGWKYWGFDPTPAPLKDDSIGAAIEAFGQGTFGSPGTMTAAYVITEAVQQVSGTRVGYAGLMLPVLEDSRIAQRWSEGKIDLDSLLAYSAVCGTGLDTVPLPGDVSEEQLARIMGDVAVLAYKWKKPLTARLQPVHGRKAGDTSNFDDPFLVNARLQPLK